jgi:excisionase family DNA binding protein
MLSFVYTKLDKFDLHINTDVVMTKDSLSKNDQREIVRVSVSEAARLFGVSTQTIRRAIKDEEVTYVVVANRYKINFESLVKWSQAKTTVKNKTDHKGIGQYVDKWKIRNTLYSPSPKSVKKKDAK